MPYLKEGAEMDLSLGLGLTEAGNMGHIVPGHHYILELVWKIVNFSSACRLKVIA